MSAITARPAPNKSQVAGSGTELIAPNKPCDSSSGPAEKNSVSVLPLLPFPNCQTP